MAGSQQKKPQAFLVATCCLLYACGCAYQKPSLKLKKVELQEADFEGATLGIVYTLKNPNPIGLRVSSVEYRLEIENHPVVSGRPPNGLRVAARGSSDLVFPARFRYQDLGMVAQVLFKQKQARYRASGKIGIGTPLGVLKVPLSYSGTFPIPQAPRFSFRSPRLRNLSLVGAQMIIPVRIVNPNAFTLPIKELSTHVTIAGSGVGNVLVSLPKPLAAGESREVEIPLNIQFRQAGLAVSNSLRKGKIPIQVAGEIRTPNSRLPFSISEVLSIR